MEELFGSTSSSFKSRTPGCSYLTSASINNLYSLTKDTFVIDAPDSLVTVPFVA